MNKKHFYPIVILLLFLAAWIQPVNAIDIPTDESVGTWNAGTRTYTLNTDITILSGENGLEIKEGGLTLDGAGHSVTSTIPNIPNPDTNGIMLSVIDGVTVKNVTVSGFVIGIRLSASHGNTLMYTTTVNNFHGIWLDSSDYNTLSDNTVSNNKLVSGAEGIGLHSAEHTIINGNTIQNNYNGIIIAEQSHYNEVYNNEFNYNEMRQACLQSGTFNQIYNNNFIGENVDGPDTVYQVHVNGGNDNQIYNNNFIRGIGTQYQAYVTGGYDNVFNLELPIGGNYWSDWTTPDDNGDGIVDNPYVIVDDPEPSDRIQDNYPWTIENGWLTPPTPQVLIVQLIDTVAEMNLQQGIDNSLDAKLDAAFNALDDVNDNNNVAAINSLNAFKNAVEAQRDNKLNGAQADELIDQADSIIDMLIE